jgi:hypothetical protein
MARTLEEKEITYLEWDVRRHAALDEVHQEDGTIRYHLEVWDGDRRPFISQWFFEEGQARDFLGRIRRESQ